MDADPPERWVLVFTVEPGDVPAAVRVKQLLKTALRRHGLVCLGVYADVPTDMHDVELVEECP
jgi:hypothetical protein